MPSRLVSVPALSSPIDEIAIYLLIQNDLAWCLDRTNRKFYIKLLCWSGFLTRYTFWQIQKIQKLWYNYIESLLKVSNIISIWFYEQRFKNDFIINLPSLETDIDHWKCVNFWITKQLRIVWILINAVL